MHVKVKTKLQNALNGLSKALESKFPDTYTKKLVSIKTALAAAYSPPNSEDFPQSDVLFNGIIRKFDIDEFDGLDSYIERIILLVTGGDVVYNAPESTSLETVESQTAEINQILLGLAE
ncbi:MAG UNVERIFIED_CONTAM: hypothetical protein LVQ98_08335 [Rickettsiaceae bacterium]|jgi:hypothetical protein